MGATRGWERFRSSCSHGIDSTRASIGAVSACDTNRCVLRRGMSRRGLHRQARKMKGLPIQARNAEGHRRYMFCFPAVASAWSTSLPNSIADGVPGRSFPFTMMDGVPPRSISLAASKSR